MRNRKLEHCLNCYTQLSLDDNFCPKCGQENHDQTVSLSVFLKDFISNYVSFDSSLFRTIPAFLFQPGKLTKKFNEGKRRTYLHPIRLYLVFSLFYFFIVSMIVPPDIFDRLMASEALEYIFDDEVDPQLEATYKKLTEQERLLADSIFQITLVPAQFATVPSSSPKARAADKLKWKEVKNLAQDTEISDEQFMLSKSRSSINLSFLSDYKQRKFIANSNLYISNALRNLPLMMFLLLPFFALLLKLLYYKSSKYYVEHLIHSLHLHAFAYLIYGIGILLLTYHIGDSHRVAWISFILVSLYAFLSIKRIQQSSWWKTTIRFFVLGFLYLNLLIMGLSIELYISLLLL